MQNLHELLQEADPLRVEPMVPLHRRDLCRQSILAAAALNPIVAKPLPQARPRIAVFAAAALTVLVALFLGALVWTAFIGNLEAAIHFEVRLAEDSPGAGLRAAKVAGSHRVIYLHDEVLVTNGEIAKAVVIPENGSPNYDIGIEFTASGAEKMRAATGNHIGRPVAILLNGQVVTAPVLKAQIGTSAMITGGYSKSQAEKIIRGIEIR